ncbi:MAG: hypothetical protein IJ092_11740 [Atopobiaceae bacterium]|nr:hypothetical protein [Atopobiaceae bacterium]
MTRLNKDYKQDTFRQTNFTSKLSITAQLEALALGTWDFYPEDEDQRVRGQAKASVRVGANYALAESFWAGPIPIVIRFSFGLNVVAGGMFGFIGPWNPLGWRWDYVSTGFDLQIRFPPTLSVGVGISGVASISLKGSFSITFSLHFGPLPAGYEDKSNPHLRLAASVALNVEAEVLFFTYSYKLAGKDWPNLYNSWNDEDESKKLGEGELVAGLHTPLPLSSLNDGKIITAASLEALAEFRTSGVQGLNPQERTLAGYTLFEADGRTVMARLYLSEDQVQSLTAKPDVTLEAAGEETEPILEPAAEVTSEELAEATDEAKAAAVASALVTELDAPTEAGDAPAEGELLVAQAEEEGLVAQEEETGQAMPDVTAVPETESVATEETADSSDEDATDEELTVQDDGSEKTFILRPTNDQAVSYVAAASDAVPMGNHSYQTIPAYDPSDVSLRLGLEQGFRPSTDIRIADNILSSSHTKLLTVGSSEDHMSFISTCSVDHEAGKGEQWFTAVPWVRCARLLSAEPYDTMLAKGDSLPFFVTLRNDGNCYLSAVDIAVSEVGGASIGEMHLEFGEDTMVGSEWNPPNEDGTLQNVEDGWALAPGTTSRYLASFVTIPEEWEGEKQIEVYVTKTYASNLHALGVLTGQAEDNSVEFPTDDLREVATVQLAVQLPLAAMVVDEDRYNDLSRADILVIGGPDGGGRRDDGGSGSKGRRALPKTDDPSRGSATAAALLAAGGVAGLATAAALLGDEEEAEL